ncbi:hypothetical protein BJ980_000288 [Nocardioides daedukensis]|uniref:Uncharacterized protein n=1 Tax=Nocardioides daedukensis TaxID=634462 RepID=A0A7Y9S0R5_9ACTN|nr:hypothetical protein [Nocardioides daedukensis]NYG57365.1 hypothetical protein [Nocardioides daedukensis]
MFFDNKPCTVCGSEVELRARDVATEEPSGAPVGPTDGVVGAGDETTDERVCTNSACPSNMGNSHTSTDSV